eukprot:CCRYP_017044-RA/>CCRYP_017044-RA protein AED:0.24 eAED:0.24 QI:0/-1/0/1/-1/0/1/0/190
MREPDYTMKIMGTASGLFSVDGRLHTRTWKEASETKTASFHYPEPFFLHFKYRLTVDDHNNLRHAVPSIEETWITTRWVLRCFQNLLAVTEVNMYLAFQFIVWDGNERMTLLEFRRMFAWEMINNPELVEAEEKLRRSKRCRNLDAEHCMQTAPKHARQYEVATWRQEGIPAIHLFWREMHHQNSHVLCM